MRACTLADSLDSRDAACCSSLISAQKMWRRSLRARAAAADDYLAGCLHTFKATSRNQFLPYCIARPRIWRDGVRCFDMTGCPSIMSDGPLRQLAEVEWTYLLSTKLVASYCDSCTRWRTFALPDMHAEQRALLAYFAQLCDTTLLEALNHHL
jgi:hypothetical protein